MFEKVELRSFRSLSSTGVLELAPLNVLVGANNTGKSSLLYALLLLRQTFLDKDLRVPFITSLPGLELGGYLDLVTGGTGERRIEYSFAFSKQVMPPPRFGLSGPRRELPRTALAFSFQLGFERETNRIMVPESAVGYGMGEDLLRVRLKGGKQRLEAVPVEIRKYLAPAFIHCVPWCYVRPSRTAAQRSFISDPHEIAARHLSMASYNSAAAVGDILDDMRYVGPLRERLARFSVRGMQAPSEVGPTGADVLRVLSSTGTLGRSSKTAVQLLAESLRETFGVLKDVRVSEVDQHGMLVALVADELEGGARGMNTAFMGFGISQLIPVALQTILLPPKGCLLVEQPEVHLHPAAQAALADLFLGNLREHRQFIVETHSEHFVLRLRRRIAEGVDPDSVRLFYFSKEGEDTIVKPMDIDSEGMVPDWPKGFFEQGYEEAMGIAQAGLSKGVSKSRKR